MESRGRARILCDLHVHLREPGMETRETIHTGALAAARGGFTTLCCMPNTQPVLDSRGVIEWVRRIAEPASARVLPIAAITKEQKGETLTEMVELAAAGAVAFSDDGKPVKASMMRHALELFTYRRASDRKPLRGSGACRPGCDERRRGQHSPGPARLAGLGQRPSCWRVTWSSAGLPGGAIMPPTLAPPAA